MRRSPGTRRRGGEARRGRRASSPSSCVKLANLRCPSECLFDSLLHRKGEIALDPLVVGVVVGREPEGELEAACADQLAERLQARLDVAALPPGDLRLRAMHPATELRLGEPRA